MPFYIRPPVLTPQIFDAVKKDVEMEVKKYIKHALRSSEIEYVFLKSVIYTEELVKNITLTIFGTEERVPIEKHLQQLRLFKEEKGILESVDLLTKIKKFRNKMAHSLEYRLEEDNEFLEELKIQPTSSIEAKKYIIAHYFKNVIHGFVYLKIGMEKVEDFVKFSPK